MVRNKSRRNNSSTKNSSRKIKSLSYSNNKNQKRIYQDIIACFMHMLNTVKLYHWKTTSYSTHKATDDLYSNLNTKIDEFVEVMLGKPTMVNARNFVLDIPTIKLKKYSNNTDFKKEVDYYKQFLINLSQKKEFSLNNNNTDLLAIRDEILALFNQFLYLLTLEN
jgi:DNA-binding ferritin-like protein